MKLENLKVEELSVREMRNIEGGSWIGRVWRWIKSHFTVDTVETPEGTGVVGGVNLNF